MFSFLSFVSLLFFSFLSFSSSSLSSSLSSSSSSSPLPIFPLQFIANLEILSPLIPIDSDYPPQSRKMKIYYDYINKQARADLEKGYEAEKQYYRNYEKKVEYMIRSIPIGDCFRAYLGMYSFHHHVLLF